MSKNNLRIDILGTDLTISADEKPEYLDMLLDKYRRAIENVQQITSLKDPLKTAILTGFLLCDDLEKAGGAKAGQNSGEVEQLTLGMISRLDEIVPEKEASVVEEANAAVFKLQNTVKNYNWGSAEWLPGLLGQRNLSRIPWAELWMGVHHSGPSRIVCGETEKPLSELIDEERETFLGKECAQKYGALPFLFKILAVEKPLSLQAHPRLDQAQRGFERETQEGISLNSPGRNYRDPLQKTELFCALGPFVSLAGFRKEREINMFMAILSQRCGEDGEETLKAGFDKLTFALETENPQKAFLAALYNFESETVRSLGAYIRTTLAVLKSGFPGYKDEWELCVYLSGIYPEDPAILAPLFLNIVKLESGEAMCLPAGTFHCYIRGMGLELMNNSDNVIRGGLTGKYTDLGELFDILDFAEYKPEILKTPNPRPLWFTYPSPSEDFSLSVIHGSANTVYYSETGPSILLITEGTAAVSGARGELILKAGESFFIPAGKKPDLAFAGSFTAYAAAAGKEQNTVR